MLEADGLVKLVEECGELTQIAAKKITRMNSDTHWDGGGSLKDRMEDEMGDVLAAMSIVSDNFGLDHDRIHTRAVAKRILFDKWMSEKGEE